MPKNRIVRVDNGTYSKIVMMLHGCACGLVSESLKMLRSAHTFNVHVKMTNELLAGKSKTKGGVRCANFNIPDVVLGCNFVLVRNCQTQQGW